MPKVSVIVPVYNVENVLHYCVDSILAQTYTDFELILVDDGSPDNSGKICDEYAKKDFQIKVIHKENGGVSSARNTGIDVAIGEYICFVDSDDYLNIDYLQQLVNVKGFYTNIDNVWCGFDKVVKGNAVNTIVADKNEEVTLFTEQDITELHSLWLDPMPWNKLFKRQVILDNNLRFNEQLSLGEDFIFNLNYLDCTNKKIVVINRPLYNYVIENENSLDSKYYENLIDIYDLTNEEFLNKATKWNLSESKIAKIYSFYFFSLEKVLLNTFRKENKTSIVNKYKYNDSLLNRQKTRICLEKMDANIKLTLKIAYNSKRYIIIKIVNCLMHICSKIKHSFLN